MMKRYQTKRFIVFVVILMLLSSHIVFSDYTYGLDNTKNMVAIKTFNGNFLCAENGGGDELVANRDQIGAWEVFQIIYLGKGYVALKGNNGDYLKAKDDDIYVDESKIGKREIFQLVKLDNNKVAFKTYNKNYICAENGGGGDVVADRKEIGNWETFELIHIQHANFDKSVLKAEAGEKSVTFTWTKPINTKNIIGYNLYRGTSSGKQSKTPITDFPVEGTSYTDNNLKSRTKYYYILKAVYKDKTLGPSSNEIEVLLEPKIILSSIDVDRGIDLFWTRPSDSKDIIGYNLYRGTSSGKQSNTPITDFPIEKTYYSDLNVKDNTIYYYILKAVYKDKTLGDASNEVSAKSGLQKKSIVLQVGSKYMLVNDKKTEIDPGKGTIMIIKNGRTFLPIRSVIEAMGGEVEWRESDKRVSIYLKNTKIYLWIGNNNAKVNGSTKETDVAPYISDSGRTMLPLRFIAENLDCQVDWDGLTKKVLIITNN